MADPRRNSCSVSRSLGLGILMLALCCGLVVPTAQAQPFPARGDDNFSSKGIFKVTLSAAYGGGTYVIKLNGPTCVARSNSHLQTALGVSSLLGDGSLCTGSPSAGTADAQIGPAPPAFYNLLGLDEVHTEILNLAMTNGQGWALRAGSNAPAQPRSLGEVEARGGASGFGGPGAASFFNLYLDVDVPASAGGPLVLYNATPLTVETSGITAFPPVGAAYIHTFQIAGRVLLYDRASGGCGPVGWLEQGTHGVSSGPSVPGQPPLRYAGPLFSTVFSVAPQAEGLEEPNPCHPIPNDVYSLGFAGAGNPAFPSWLYPTQGELFQSSGAILGGVPDITNVDRISASLALGPAPGGPPPYVGPFSTTGPAPVQNPPGGPGTLGLVPGDDIASVSFGWDGGNVLLFSVDPTAVGAAGSAVDFHSTLSPPAVAMDPGGGVPSNGGGNLIGGGEAAGDIYYSPPVFPPGTPFMFGGGAVLVGVLPAPPFLNTLALDEVFLGLQAPATRYNVLGPPEDDLDALEADDAARVDADVNGVVDPGAYVFFTLSGASPTLPVIPAMTNDILVFPNPGGILGIYASGAANIGLLQGDVVDALALYDSDQAGFLPPDGILTAWDEALFSLAAGSPSLVPGANPAMPAGPLSPGDVYYTRFPGPAGPILMMAAAPAIGLLAADELNALDIGYCGFCEDGHEWPTGSGTEFDDDDNDGVRNVFDICPEVPNPYEPIPGDTLIWEQPNNDGDPYGDPCDSDPFCYNPIQTEFPCVCGDSIWDPETEECDKNDDAACPGQCSPDCRCGTGVQEQADLPKAFALHQNVPNPFNATTTIRFDIPVGVGEATLEVFDVTGRRVRTLVYGEVTPGEKQVVWNGRNDKEKPVSSGTYFYRLRAADFEQTRKMLLLQ